MTDMTGTPAPVAWKVLQQIPALVKGPTGVYADGYRITAQIPSGATFTVEVVKGPNLAERARQALATEAEQVTQVDKLEA